MLNKITLIGNLGTDPEMGYTPNGNPVTSFTVATNHKYTNSSGERKEEVEWFKIVCWNKLAESTNQYLAKGSKAYVEGRLQSKTWSGQDGVQHFTNEVVASNVVFLDPAGNKSDAEPVAAGVESPTEGDSENLPW